MLLEKGHRGELLVNFAWLAVDFDEAFILREFFECVPAGLVEVEDVGELAIGDDILLDGCVRTELGHDDNVFKGHLNREGATLQMGHWLFLLITRIL